MSRRKPIAVQDELFPHVKVFFPHSRKDYGSERAQEAERAIRAAWPGCELIDPRFINWKRLAREEGDSANADEVVVRDCNIVVALEHNQHIGRGVHGGLAAALRLGRPAYVYRNGKMLRVGHLISVDPEDWALRFARVQAVPEEDLEHPDPHLNGEEMEEMSDRFPEHGDK